MENQNYLALYYKKGFHKEENRETPFNLTKSADYEKTLQAKNKLINKLREVSAKILDFKVAEGLSMFPKAELEKYYVQYEPYRTTNLSNCFKVDTGLKVMEIPEDAAIIQVERKRGFFYLPYGYVYERGIIYVSKMRYSISPKNDAITYTRETLYAIHILSGETFMLEGETFVPKRLDYDLETTVLIGPFIQKLYGVEYAPNLSIMQYIKAIRSNNLFEELLKTAPKWMIDRFITTYAEQKTLLEFFDIPKEYKPLMVEKQKFVNFVSMKEVFIDSVAEDKKLTYSEVEELLEMFAEIKEEFSMHEIEIYNRYSYRNTCRGIKKFKDSVNADIKQLMIAYSGGLVSSFYTPKKYYRYMLDAVVNQGFSSINDFSRTHNDYLEMCREQGMKPQLYSDYIRRTHDTLSRNQKIKLQKEEREAFLTRYTDTNFAYAPKQNVFCIVIPKSPEDVIDEGNILGHCVASYVKRIAAGSTHIVFLRKREDPKTPLVTVQVTNNKVVQAKGATNRRVKTQEITFLKTWAEKRKIEWGM